MKYEWENVGLNSIISAENDEFYISYNPGNFMIPSFGSDTGGAETALCKDGDFFILNGDFRKDYEKLIAKGFEKCKEFYNSKKEEFCSSWSD